MTTAAKKGKRAKAVKPPRRRNPGAVTRAAILAAARERFANDGYERATVRGIAADSGIDPALVMRHFGSKEALFAEAADLDLQLPDLHGVGGEDLARVLLPSFFAVWEDDTTFLALLRSSMTHEVAALALREVFARQVAPKLAAVALDHPLERAALVGSQILGLVVARYVLRVPPLVNMSREELMAWVSPVLQQYLLGALPPRVRRPSESACVRQRRSRVEADGPQPPTGKRA
jgi:AcrR family transcriptional regulator